MAELMSDLDNRFWLCEQVIEVRQQGGMSLERALAMLHKLTELESHEPYLSDQPVFPAITWDLAEVDKDEMYSRLERGEYERTPCVATDLETAWPGVSFDDGLGPLPSAEEVLTTSTKTCVICGAVLERKPRESYASFQAKETCSKSHAGILRGQRRREERAREAVAA